MMDDRLEEECWKYAIHPCIFKAVDLPSPNGIQRYQNMLSGELVTISVERVYPIGDIRTFLTKEGEVYPLYSASTVIE